MRERLIELLIDGLGESEILSHMYGEPIGTDFQKFADYLLQNGVVVLPCKIGDRVYQYGKAFTRCSAYDYKPRYEDDSECEGCCAKCDSECVDELYTGTVSQIQYGDGWTHVIVKCDNAIDNGSYIVRLTVFLTKEEAAEVLERGKQ